jgi:hypothetical protein
MWRGERFEIADPSTPLGMLQRGRGAAYLWAREAEPEEAARLVLRCLEEDPRWDRAVEDRTPLYVDVAHRVRLHPAPLLAILHRDTASHPQASHWMTATVLAALARHGDGEAREGLLEVVAAGAGWEPAAFLLVEHGMTEGVERTLARRMREDDDARREMTDGLLDPWRHEPWRSWSRRELVLDTIAEARRARDRERTARAPHPGMELEELLAHPDRVPAAEALAAGAVRDGRLHWIARDPISPDRGRAFLALSIRGDEELVDEAAALVSADERPLAADARRYLRDLPPGPARAHVLEWRHGDDARLAELARQMRCDEAEEADVAEIAGWMEPALDAGRMLELCDVLDALEHFPALGPFPGVDRVFEEAPYSYARIRAVALMRLSDPGFGERRADECLWDGEERIRQLGAEAQEDELPVPP